ncbi:DUF572-domain-containing protein [Wallemia mellicola]|uniref:DUF572-domain-containing protein n=2 Tax=Wallemia mellicola TaxID=1708541 RepID=A0A4T0N6S0_9BASI|nr:hypothetical protein E3Q23_02991 [Wallemia mellicola]TIB73657.1 hypothetical protein E3Q24_00995 [Wallemia mellicola]TIB89318.1 DUF572-domain-containing protein [Wallemia mellicola]TIB90386.1 DUF572-domain-containing protein [Wallemia mellicola]TIB92121.1 DUF572-domain-containing protein [Wallemia mellicola]
MQGFNRYYPPDYDPQKHSSLGDRARKIDKGILIVRFELPFDIWCGGCEKHVGQGVRYNAEKRKIGNYYSTPIYAFRCKCHLCSHWFEIQTDPKNTRYIVSEGAKQKAEWQPEEGETITMETDPDKKPAVDPFAAVEKGTNQVEAQKKVVPRLSQIGDANDATWSDPYAMNQKLRAKHRVERRQEHASNRANLELKDRYALPEDLQIIDDQRDNSESSAFKQIQRRKATKKPGDLKSTLISNTRKKMDPFDRSSRRFKFREN